jgi:hypothetical protein
VRDGGIDLLEVPGEIVPVLELEGVLVRRRDGDHPGPPCGHRGREHVLGSPSVDQQAEPGAGPIADRRDEGLPHQLVVGRAHPAVVAVEREQGQRVGVPDRGHGSLGVVVVSGPRA